MALPAAEVHISDVTKREPFRQISYAGMACQVHVIGQGIAGYVQAAAQLKAQIEQRKNTRAPCAMAARVPRTRLCAPQRRDKSPPFQSKRAGCEKKPPAFPAQSRFRAARLERRRPQQQKGFIS